MIWRLARHEWRRTRATLLFWLLLAAGQLVIAWLIYAQIELYDRMAPQLTASGSRLGATDLIITPTFGSMVLLLLIAVPLLTQGGYAGESRSGRLSLWLGAPVSSVALVFSRIIGVFLATLPLLLSTSLTLGLTGIGIEVDWPRFFTGLGLLGLYALWLSCVTVSLSTLVDHPAAALAMSYGVLLFLWLLDEFVAAETGLYWLALLPHTESAFEGLLRSTDLVFFAVTGSAAIGLAIYRLATWRGEL